MSISVYMLIILCFVVFTTYFFSIVNIIEQKYERKEAFYVTG